MKPPRLIICPEPVREPDVRARLNPTTLASAKIRMEIYPMKHPENLEPRGVLALGKLSPAELNRELFRLKNRTTGLMARARTSQQMREQLVRQGKAHLADLDALCIVAAESADAEDVIDAAFNQGLKLASAFEMLLAHIRVHDADEAV